LPCASLAIATRSSVVADFPPCSPRYVRWISPNASSPTVRRSACSASAPRSYTAWSNIASRPGSDAGASERAFTVSTARWTLSASDVPPLWSSQSHSP
jgi:hypothetical protein